MVNIDHSAAIPLARLLSIMMVDLDRAVTDYRANHQE
jgi:hypothetical protein